MRPRGHMPRHPAENLNNYSWRLGQSTASQSSTGIWGFREASVAWLSPTPAMEREDALGWPDFQAYHVLRPRRCFGSSHCCWQAMPLPQYKSLPLLGEKDKAISHNQRGKSWRCCFQTSGADCWVHCSLPIMNIILEPRAAFLSYYSLLSPSPLLLPPLYFWSWVFLFMCAVLQHI